MDYGRDVRIYDPGSATAHGANIPARSFLFLDEDDVGVLIEALRNHLVISFEG